MQSRYILKALTQSLHGSYVHMIITSTFPFTVRDNTYNGKSFMQTPGHDNRCIQSNIYVNHAYTSYPGYDM